MVARGSAWCCPCTSDRAQGRGPGVSLEAPAGPARARPRWRVSGGRPALRVPACGFEKGALCVPCPPAGRRLAFLRFHSNSVLPLMSEARLPESDSLLLPLPGLGPNSPPWGPRRTADLGLGRTRPRLALPPTPTSRQLPPPCPALKCRCPVGPGTRLLQDTAAQEPAEPVPVAFTEAPKLPGI